MTRKNEVAPSERTRERRTNAVGDEADGVESTTAPREGETSGTGAPLRAVEPSCTDPERDDFRIEDELLADLDAVEAEALLAIRRVSAVGTAVSSTIEGGSRYVRASRRRLLLYFATHLPTEERGAFNDDAEIFERWAP